MNAWAWAGVACGVELVFLLIVVAFFKGADDGEPNPEDALFHREEN